MEKFSVREARERLATALDRVAAGEEVLITRRGRAEARLVRAEPDRVTFPDRKALRASLPPARESAAAIVRQQRDEERY